VEIGIGLPNAIPCVEGETMLDWARAADHAGFSSLATTDRLVYLGYDAPVTLAAAAAVTTRCRLMTAVLLSALRTNTAVLAKQVATLDRLAEGRLVLGLAVGSRPDDFAAAGASYSGRGEFLEGQLAELARIWDGERRGFAGPIGPAPYADGGPEIVLGGHSPGALDRAARLGGGWISGAAGPEMFARGAAAVHEGWQRYGRRGRPRLLALCYFSLGPDADRHAAGHLGDYYGFAPRYAEMVLRAAAVGPDQVRAAMQAYAAAGCDELLMMPCWSDLRQVELLRGCVQDWADSRPPRDARLMTRGWAAGEAVLDRTS
jgi:alkanesulfonate monooxygenase SsuD/methylene tetrahydromethanopterin reductase-like flavin-dependent oxidoreductase (luciferase family)